MLQDRKRKKHNSLMKRDLYAQLRSDNYRALFTLPRSEKLHGDCSCSLWLPYEKTSVRGKLYISHNFVCFNRLVQLLTVSDLFRLPSSPPPPQLSGCIVFATPRPDARAIFLHNDLLCNGTCSVTGGGGVHNVYGGGGGGGVHKWKRPPFPINMIWNL